MKNKLFATALAVMLLLSACNGNMSSSVPPDSSKEVTIQVTADPSAETGSSNRDILAIAAEIEFAPENYTDILLDIPYMDDGEEYHLIDLYGTQSGTSTAPTIIEVHGGGFISGTRGNNADHSIFFAERGYKVVVPDYGKVPGDGDFKNAIQELFTVFHWVEENADTYGFDLNNVFLSGDSAGGYYTLLCCAILYSPDLQAYFDVTPPDFQFNACVTSCPRTELSSIRDGLTSGNSVASQIAKKIGEELLLDDDLMNHMDLMINVAPEAFTNLYMMTTPGDTDTGSSVLAFDAYLTEHGVEHTMISYDGVENKLGHTFNISCAHYPESKVANQDMTDYLDAHLR